MSMENKKKDIGKLVSFYEMLTDKEELIHKILIPKIQRDYVQGRVGEESVRERFLESLFGTIDDNASQDLILDFVFGQKEDEKKVIFYPVDGQQRLTTLFLLHLYIGKRAGKDIDFLKKFSYETRESSKQFCQKLITIKPENFYNIKHFIDNEWWYTGLWRNDPTIIAMINMLDAIDCHYKEKTYTENDFKNAFENLKNKVKFWRLNLSDLNTTDELYIKMNSRGKKLTDFEHIKAMLEDFTGGNGKLSKEFDTSWTNLLWKYTEKNSFLDLDNEKYTENGLDTFFHNLLLFYLNIEGCKRGWIDYQNLETDLVKLVNIVLGFQKPKDDLTDVELNTLKSEKKKEAEVIMKRFENIMNFFAAQNSQKEYLHDPETFFNDFIQCKYDNWVEDVNGNTFLNTPQKVFIGVRKNSDLLFDVCTTGILKNLPTLYTEAFFEYASAPTNPNDFLKRFRQLRNLLENTEIHARDFSTTLKVVDELISKGNMEIANVNDELNKTQKEQEIFKQTWLLNNSSYSNLLEAIENHWLILGNLNIFIITDEQKVPVDINIAVLERFGRLFNFNCDYLLTERALLTVGDYSPAPKIRGIKSYGGADWGRWKDFTQSFNRTTPVVFQTFLQEFNDFKNLDLEKIIENGEIEPKYTWTYYLRTYEPVYMAPKAKYRYLEGEYSYQKVNANGGGGKEFYWNPYNLVVQKLLESQGFGCSVDSYGGPLSFHETGIIANIKEKTIEFIYPDGYKFEHLIPQDEFGIDKVNRIVYAIGACKRINRTYTSESDNVKDDDENNVLPIS